MSASLLQQEAAADAAYGFPAGTLEALGATESSQGKNLGSIGNVFQILPSTAANPGYGLGQLDGNNPMDAGAYLNALLQGPAGGNLATAFAMYQGGAANPTPYGSNTPVANFLASLTGGAQTSAPVTANAGTTTPDYSYTDPNTLQTFTYNPQTGNITMGNPVTNGQATVPPTTNVFSQFQAWFAKLETSFKQWLSGEAANIGFIIVGVVILIGALLLFGKDGVEKIT